MNDEVKIEMSHKKPFSHIVLGGTFDRLHDGHYLLLKIAGSIAESISIGLTSTKYLGQRPKKYQEKVLPYTKRLENLIIYLNNINIDFNFYIFPINHPWKNFSIKSPVLDSIIVSEETLPSVNIINNVRDKNGLNTLCCVVIPGAITKNGKIFSSTDLRKKL